MIKIFGVLDIIAAIVLITLKFAVIKNLGLIFGVYLILKGLVFLNKLDFANIFDIACGVLLILAGYGTYSIINFLAVIWLLQKGFFSFMS